MVKLVDVYFDGKSTKLGDDAFRVRYRDGFDNTVLEKSGFGALRLPLWAQFHLGEEDSRLGEKMYSRIAIVASLLFLIGGVSGAALAESSAPLSQKPEKIIIDTDIGSDIDDAFAVALALRSPELNILGISTDSGDTEGRAKILDRMLGEVGRQDIPVAVGVTTPPNPTIGLVDQKHYGETGHFARTTHPKAVDFVLDQIRRYPGEITLVTIGPVPNIGAMIDKSPETFRKLKRVVIMGGFIDPIKPDYGNAPPIELFAEYNIQGDIGSSQKLFLSGVPLYVMPLDSTLHLSLDEVKRGIIFSQGTPLTDSLTMLYHQWGGQSPILFDAMTIAYILNPQLCPVQPMDIRVDDKGFTRVDSGTPNALVCLHSDADAFFRFYMSRLLAQ
jgi:purine nucleosidase